MTFYLSMTIKSLLIWILIILILIAIAFVVGFCIGSDGQDEKGIRADERENFLKEICKHEKTMIDNEGKIHFVVKMVDVMKVFNKEKNNE